MMIDEAPTKKRLVNGCFTQPDYRAEVAGVIHKSPLGRYIVQSQPLKAVVIHDSRH